MAERRMFAKTIVLSDAFLDMPLSARCLYFTLGMLADDDGFINSPKSIMRQCGASNDDMNILLAKKFLIAFESGVFVIKHWRINNYLRSDRYTETKYIEEKNHLLVEENGGYTVGVPSGIPSIGKSSLEIGKVSGEGGEPLPTPKRFIPPTLEEITAYCRERKNNVNPQKFLDHYTTVGWKRGKTPIKDWKACVRLWENDEKGKKGTASEKYNRED